MPEGDTFTSIENLSGSAFDDTLTGDTADNVLEGGDGADTLDGGAGADTASWAASDCGNYSWTSLPARIPVGTRQAILSTLSKTCWAPATQMCSPVTQVGPTALSAVQATTV